MLKSILLVFTGASLALLHASTLGQTPQQPTTAAPEAATAPAAGQAKALGPMPADMKSPIKPTADSRARARQIYQIDCAMCHGDSGNGKSDLATSMSLTLDDWTDSKALANKMDGELFDIIRTGKNQMPPEDPGRAKDNDIWNLVIFIRGFSKTPASPEGSDSATR